MAAPTPSELEHKAKEAFVDDDFALATALYTQAIAAGAPAAALYADRAQAYIKMGDFAAAAADAARAAELDPAMPRAHLRRAHACVKLEQYDAARAAVEVGAALAPGDARFAQLMKEIDAKAPKPMETDASPAAAVATATPAPADKPKYRHDYYNSAAEVVVTVFAKGVAAEHVAVEFGEQLLSVSVEVPGETPYHLQPRHRLRRPEAVVPVVQGQEGLGQDRGGGEEGGEGGEAGRRRGGQQVLPGHLQQRGRGHAAGHDQVVPGVQRHGAVDQLEGRRLQEDRAQPAGRHGSAQVGVLKLIDHASIRIAPTCADQAKT
jgi:hypothetical protein